MNISEQIAHDLLAMGALEPNRLLRIAYVVERTAL